MLERTEQSLGLGYSAASITEPYSYALLLDSGRDAKLAARLVQQCTFAVLSQIEEDLHQTLPVGPYRRNTWLHEPSQLDVFFAQRGFDHDSQLFEQRLQINTGGLIGGLA